MKIVHISTSDTGGAGIAALRLHQAMLKKNIDSQFLCLYNNTATPAVTKVQRYFPNFIVRQLNKTGIALCNEYKNQNLLLKIKNKVNAEMLSFPSSDYELHKHSQVSSADIIILHWVAGFLDYKSFFRNIDHKKQIFWYLHDFNLIQGIFHTLTDSNANDDNSVQKLEKRIKAYKESILKSISTLTFIANSEYTASIFKQSNVHNGENIITIPLGIPENELQRIKKNVAKEALGFQSGDFMLLIGSTNFNSKRKGLERLMKALKRIALDETTIHILFLGPFAEFQEFKSVQYHFLDEVWSPVFKSIIFSAADMVVSTSYEETFGQTIIEGYACGTGSIVFNNAALPELVINGKTGFIVNDVAELSENIMGLANNRKLISQFGDNGYNLFHEKFKSSIQVESLIQSLK